MKIHRIATTGTALDFDAALKRASAVADELIGENMLLSWYDRERDLESPAHAGECHEGCPVRGYWDYALRAYFSRLHTPRWVWAWMDARRSAQPMVIPLASGATPHNQPLGCCILAA